MQRTGMISLLQAGVSWLAGFTRRSFPATEERE